MRVFLLFLCLFFIPRCYANTCFSGAEASVDERLTQTDSDSKIQPNSSDDDFSSFLKDEKNSFFWDKISFISKEVEKIRTEILERFEKETFSKDDIHFSDVLVWNKKDFSPITEYEGIGDWTTYPCMKTRLLSDSTGTLKRPWIFGGIDVSLEKGCLFKDFEISVDEIENISPLRFFIPYLFPLSGIQYEFRNRIVFPFLAIPEKQGENALMAVTLSGQLCKDGEACVFVALPMRLQLKGDTGNVTSVSAYVNQAFSRVPDFVDQEKISAVLLSNRKIQLRAKTTTSIGKQAWLVKHNADFIPFKITDAFVWEKNGYLTFEFEQDIENTELTFVLKDSDVFWETTLTAEKGAQFIKPEVVSFNWFKLAILFFFLSPWLSFMMLFNPKNDWEVKEKTTHVIVQVISFSVLAYFFLKTGAVFKNPFEDSFWRWSMFFLFLGSFLFPIKKTAFSFALLSFCAPLMYLSEPIKIYPKTTLFVCTLTALAPFIYAKRHPHTMLKLWVGLNQLNEYMKKLPLLVCAGWILLMQGAIFYNQNVDYPIFSSEKVSQAISEEKIVLVLGGDKTCVICAWNKFYWKKTKAKHWFPLVVFKTDDKQPQFLYGPFEPDGIKLPDSLNSYNIDEWFSKVIIHK